MAVNQAVSGDDAPAAVSSPTGNLFADAGLFAANAYNETSAAATAFGWQPVSADALGIAGSGTFGADGYRFAGGVYVASDADNSAVAHVYVGALDGVSTLALAFRGTDEIPGDIEDHRTFTTHYAHFQPLIAGLEQYLAGAGSGIERVLVTGHSLGSAMVATAMIEEGWANDPRYLGVAFAAHGADASVAAAAPAPVTNLVNFVHTQDPLLLSSDPALGLPSAAIASPLGALSQALNELAYEEKARVGTDIWIDTGNAARLIEPGGARLPEDPTDAEHRLGRHVADVTFLAEQGQLDPSALLSSPEPRFFYVTSDEDDNIAQDRAFASDSLNQRFFPAQEFDQQMFAQGGDDVIAGARGNDTIDGGEGTDVALFGGARADYAISTADGITRVTETAATAANDGADALTNVEYLAFADGVVPADDPGGPVPDAVLEAAGREPIDLAGGLDLVGQAFDGLLS